MSQTTKVDVIIKSLSELESEIDSVNLSLADMKKITKFYCSKRD